MNGARTPADWCDVFGLDLLGDPPRGWRDETAPGWGARVTLAEFYQRACRSKLGEDYSRHGWLALMDAAQRIADERAAAGTNWVIQVDRHFGALLADGEQIRLPGPVTGLNTEQRIKEIWSDRHPTMITPGSWPEHEITVLVRPRPRDRWTLIDATMTHGAGRVYATTCPTCGTRHEPENAGAERTDDDAAR